MTFGSLFAGIGGFDLGFERAGMRCVWQVEIDDYANRVLAKHWPRVKRWRDIRTWPQPDTERPGVICGGFPCQDISYAGRGAGLDGERSGLFFEAVRVVRELRPRVVVLENVAGLLTRGLDRVLGTLAEIGFDAEWHCLPAAAFGAPHIRDRVFVLAHSQSERQAERASCGGEVLAHAESQGRQGQRVAGEGGGEGGGEHARGGSCGGGSAKDVPDADNAGRRRGAKQRSIGDVEPLLRGKVWPVSGHAWETEPDVGRVADGVSHRVDRLRGLGNAVVPQVAEWIGRRIVEACR